MEIVERFVVLLYDRASTKNRVNEACQQLFAQKETGLDAIPPAQAALLQHTKRAAYQAGHCRGQARKPHPQLPCPRNWGWSPSADGWQPLWTTLPDVTASCRELVKCGCKKGCRGNCLCIKAALKYTALCACRGERQQTTELCELHLYHCIHVVYCKTEQGKHCKNNPEE